MQARAVLGIALRLLAYLPVSLTGTAAVAQSQPEQRGTEAAGPAVVRGLYNWVHTSGDAEQAFEFYRDVFGIELAPSPFYGDPDTPPQAIRPAAEAGSDALVWDLTNTHGARFRTAFLRAPNTPFGLELAEFFDIPRATRAAQPWDPGASVLMFDVRDLTAVLARARDRGAPIVTAGGAPLDTPRGRSIVVRNPDGYLIRITQAPPRRIAAAAPGDVIATSIGITVADISAAFVFYHDLLGFEFGQPRAATRAEMRVYGLGDGALVQREASIPGTEVRVVFSEFSLPEGGGRTANPFQWQLQDVGAPQFQLQVAGLDALLERTAQAGYRFLSVDGRPIQRPFGRFVFAIDADGVLVEYVEPQNGR